MGAAISHRAPVFPTPLGGVSPLVPTHVVWVRRDVVGRPTSHPRVIVVVEGVGASVSSVIQVINHYMRHEGPWQRLAAAHRTTAAFTYTHFLAQIRTTDHSRAPPSPSPLARPTKEKKSRPLRPPKRRKKGNFIFGGPGPPFLPPIA